MPWGGEVVKESGVGGKVAYEIGVGEEFKRGGGEVV